MNKTTPRLLASLPGSITRSVALVVAVLGMGGAMGANPAEAAKKGHDYVISINYELGMHCTGFDFSYCCVLPPYNSIQSQVIKHSRLTDGKDARPQLLGADPNDPSVLVDGDKRFKLYYEHVGNSYSEGNKMAYWNVPYDLNGDGNPYGPNESVANAYFRHLYIYKDLEGSNPEGTSEDAKKLRVGIELPIPLDSGPSGQKVSGDYLRYSTEKGTVVYTKGPVLDNVPIVLTNPGIWEALGLPLTGFSDRDMEKGIMRVTEQDIQPYQMAKVTMVDEKTGEAYIDSTGKPVSFTGTNPIDIPNCFSCHAGSYANGTEYIKYKEEKNYWLSLGASEFYAKLKATAISVLEIHDANNGTDFLKNYNAKASSNRLGREPVLCQACHADNVIGKLNSKKIGDVVKNPKEGKSKDQVIPALTEAIHSVHLKVRPMPDSKGRTGSCQGCHPAHRQDRSMEGFPIAANGKNTYKDGDNRDAAGGCFVGRDVHSNPNAQKDVTTPENLNAVGKYLQENVVHEEGNYKGLWCTNCHNQLSREFYQRDSLTNAFKMEGETIRNKSLEEIAQSIGVTKDELISRYIDPKVPLSGEDNNSGVKLTWAKAGERTIADIAVIEVDKKGNPVVTKDKDGDVNVHILSANPKAKVEKGAAVPYNAATHGNDYWLSAGEPHCADCHEAPFVEGQGGVAFPINQPGKYSLMRYSKGHAGLSCQSCHQSIHGLFSANPKVDQTTFNQAAMMNPDGSHGPVKCAACHDVNSKGVPKIAEDKTFRGKKIGKDFSAAVAFMHETAPDMGGAIPEKKEN